MNLKYCLIVAALLSGCGGGGGNSPAPEPVPNEPPVSPTHPPEDGSNQPPPAVPPEPGLPPVEPPAPTQPPAPPAPDEPAQPAHQPPVAVDDQAVFKSNSLLNSIDVLANDFDNSNSSVHLASVSATSGSAFVDDGKLWYSAAPDFVGRDLLNYEIRNRDGLTARAQVEVMVVSEDGRTVEIRWDWPAAADDVAGIIVSQRDLQHPFLETVVRADASGQESIFLTVAEDNRYEFKVAFVDSSGALSAWSDVVTTDDAQ